MDSVKQLRIQCRQLGAELSGQVVEENDLCKMFAKIIVANKVMDEEAFEIAESAFSETYKKPEESRLSALQVEQIYLNHAH